MIKDTALAGFQLNIDAWLRECLGAQIAYHIQERGYRFFEEALELVQSAGITKEEVLKLVDYTYTRPVGEPAQEVGGVMVTLAALCTALELDLIECSLAELDRIRDSIEVIRAKHHTKLTPIPKEVHHG